LSGPEALYRSTIFKISSNKGSNCIPSLRNCINDENFDDIVYGDEVKCDLLNKYFSLVSKLEEENVPLYVFVYNPYHYFSDTANQ
jgi:hypothetical protein